MMGKSQPDRKSIESKMAHVTLNTPAVVGICQSKDTPELALVASTGSNADNINHVISAHDEEILPLTKFTCFPALPIELRLAIWALSCQNPRNVGVWIRQVRNITFPHDDPEKKARGEQSLRSLTNYGNNLVYKSHAGIIPSILHTSCESRLVGLEHYSPLANSEKQTILLDPKVREYIEYTLPSQLYFNSAKDVLIVPPYHSPWRMKEALQRPGCKLRKVAIKAGEFFFDFLSTICYTQSIIEEMIIYWIPECYGYSLGEFDDDNPVDFELLPIDDPAVDFKERDEARHFLEFFDRLHISFSRGHKSLSESVDPIVRQMVLLVKPRES